MITPEFLREGDSLVIVAPGGRVEYPKLEYATSIIESWGLHVHVGKNVYNKSHSYLAGTDSQRLSDLQEALNHENVKAILCARGGYGTTRIVDQLDFSFFLKNPKWIVGYSDITALHLALSKLGVESIHGTMPLLFSRPQARQSIESLYNLLFGKSYSSSVAQSSYSRSGQATGAITGGNLSLLVDSIGTKYELDTSGKILVIEEVEEYKYRFDRMLTHLKRAGKFEKLKGLIVGYTTGIHDGSTQFDESVEEIVLNKVSNFNFPVAFGFSFGHEEPNIAVRLGQHIKLTVTEGRSFIEPCS